MKPGVISLDEKLRAVVDHWSPKVIAEVNDYQIKLVKIQGEFVWHKHDDTDEVFICLRGAMGISFRDGEARLKQGEMIIVPRGVEHKPFAQHECEVMLIEPRGVVNTGDADATDLTAAQDVWI